MQNRSQENGLTVNAIAGTHVVLLGLNLEGEARKGCLGFAIQREDHTEDERTWMSGMKVFEATDPLLGPGGQGTRSSPSSGPKPAPNLPTKPPTPSSPCMGARLPSPRRGA